MRTSFRLSTVLLTLVLYFCPALPGSARSGGRVSGADSPAGGDPAPSTATMAIPGPLRPFLRLAAVSQKVSLDEVLPLLARHVVMEGYGGQERPHSPTEYLILVKRYVEQARELQALAGPDGVIRVSQCSAAQPLLTVIGYRLREPCGPNTSLETSDAKRAFITVDSGFPLVQLENTLRGDKPFAYPFGSSQVPVLFSRDEWAAMSRDKGSKDLLDSLLGDPALARLYWALARMDDNTRTSLRQSPGLTALLPLAPVLDFYGEQLHLHSGRVVVPGGPSAESAWKQLVGASPDSPGDFIPKLLAKDEGWLAVYFDALSRVSGSQQAYFTEPRRLVRFYEALRGRDPSPGPARPVFRPDPALLLLVTRCPLDANGKAHIAGNLDVWREIIRGDKETKTARDWGKHTAHIDNADSLLESFVALSRVSWGRGPLQIFLTVSEIERERSSEQPLSPETVRLLAKDYEVLSDQYPVFAEFHVLNDTSITRFINLTEALDQIPDAYTRAEALGILQANVGLWEILARQGQIPVTNWNNSWQSVIHPFGDVHTTPQLFDATRSSLAELFRAASGKPRLTQDQVILLLAGPNPTNQENSEIRQKLANQMRSVLEAQRLVSFDTLMGLGDGLSQKEQGKPSGESLLPLAEELREFEMPKPVFTTGERIDWTAGPFSDPHTQSEMQTNLAEVVKSQASAQDLAAARGRLVPFLRDFLVGLNYAYYEPPGAVMLHNNPLLVRRHDFSGEITRGADHPWRTPRLVGRGDTSGGGVRLAGGLVGLPYVLSEVEQQFVVPENVQSLIWEDLVPSLMTSAVLARWWRVTRDELHAVTLLQRFGEELLTGASTNDDLRQKVVGILPARMDPRRVEEVEKGLRAGHPQEVISQVTPAECFYLAMEFRRGFPAEANGLGKTGPELARLAERSPQEINPARLSEDFGVPHPALAQTYRRELLNLKPFPTFLGYFSRLMAESWESNNLFWARLADEKGLPPEALNQLVPDLTRRMVEKIFATHLDDWPSLLRALQETGTEFREGKMESLPKTSSLAPL